MTSIVTVNVSQTIAPTPSKLQKTGALISQGATTLAADASSLLTQLADLADIIRPAAALTALAWSGGIVTAATVAPHGFPTGDIVPMTIAGASPAGYNGTFDCTITGASGFTYAVASDPGAETVPGTYIPAAVAELTAMATTFFAQGAQQGVYVLELGGGDAATGVAALEDWIDANPGFFYSYLAPRSWADESTYLTFLAGFEALTSKTYFFTTVDSSNYSDFEDIKCVFALIEAPATPATEFSAAAPFHVTLNYDPSSTNKVTPTAFSYLFGVTAYPTAGNSVLLAALKAAGVNVVGTGAEGGISNAILLWGTTMDVRDFTYWYSVDWVQINAELDLAAAVINGSNNPANPLYYNQDGINRLQAVLAGTMSRAITFGMALGTVIQTALDGAQFQAALNDSTFAGSIAVNAVPFIPYSADNPSDYSVGRYAGLSVQYTPARGFIAIVVNLNVSDFVTQ